MSYRLTCMICGHRDDDLVRMQEHAMNRHGYGQEDHRNATRRQGATEGSYVYTMPDGIDWLHAKKRDK